MRLVRSPDVQYESCTIHMRACATQPPCRPQVRCNQFLALKRQPHLAVPEPLVTSLNGHIGLRVFMYHTIIVHTKIFNIRNGEWTREGHITTHNNSNVSCVYHSLTHFEKRAHYIPSQWQNMNWGWIEGWIKMHLHLAEREKVARWWQGRNE